MWKYAIRLQYCQQLWNFIFPTSGSNEVFEIDASASIYVMPAETLVELLIAVDVQTMRTLMTHSISQYKQR